MNSGGQLRINILRLPEKPFSDITDFGELSTEQINSYPTHVWSSVKEEVLKTLNSEQAMAVLDQIKVAGKISLWAKLLDALKPKLDWNQIISLIKTTQRLKGSYAKQISQSLSEQLGDAKNWTYSLLNQLESSCLNFLPSDLLKIQSFVAKVKLLSLLEVASENHDHEILIINLVEQVYGPIKSWISINETIAKWLPRMSPLQLNDINVHTVMQHLQTISNLEFGDRAHAQPVIQKVFSTILPTTSLAEAQELFLRMGKLIMFLRLQDIEQFPLYWFNDILIQNVVSQSGNEDKALGRYILTVSGPTNGQWTHESVTQLQTFLPYASHQLLTHLVNKQLLNRQSLSFILNRLDLDLGQIQALREMGESTYKHEGKWDLTSMPISMMYVLSSEDISTMRPEDLVNNMRKFNVVAHRFDTIQKIAITNKLCELGLDRVSNVNVLPSPEFIKMITDQQLLTLGNKDSEKLIQSMPTNSPQVRRYLEKKYGHKKLTVEDLRMDRILALTASCDLLMQFSDHNIMELLLALRTATPQPLRLKTTKCLADKLKTYLKSQFEDDADDEEHILSMVKQSELGIIGGDVLIHFSTEALQEQTPSSKCQQIFYLIGHQPLTTINLLQPQERKRQLARAAINCLDKQEDILDLADMTIIGNLMGYLPEIAVDKMNNDAFKFNLQLLMGSELYYDFAKPKMVLEIPETLGKFTVTPCLSSAMRQAIRRKLTKVMRQPETWDETKLQTIGCLLSTLYLEQLRSIRNKVIVSVADELDQCSKMHVSNTQHEEFGIFTTMCRTELLGATLNIEEAEKQLKQRLKNAIIEHSTSNKRIKREFNRLTCDVIRVANSVLMESCLEELNTISTKEILDCLEDIGKFPMTKEKATILWNKVKQAYGKLASTMDQSTYYLMGFITQGMHLSEIATLHLNNTSIISMFGEYHNFSSAQVHALAAQIKSDYQSRVERYTTTDFLSMGYIVCGLQVSDIEKMSSKVFVDISYRMSDQFSTCSQEIKNVLARKAVQGFGPSYNWTSATVTSICSILGGLTVDQLSSIPGRSFEGIVPSLVDSFPPEVIKVLTPVQLGNLTVEAVNYFTQDQLSQLNAGQLQVVNQIKSLYNRSSRKAENILWTLAVMVVSGCLPRIVWHNANVV